VKVFQHQPPPRSQPAGGHSAIRAQASDGRPQPPSSVPPLVSCNGPRLRLASSRRECKEGCHSQIKGTAKARWPQPTIQLQVDPIKPLPPKENGLALKDGAELQSTAPHLALVGQTPCQGHRQTSGSGPSRPAQEVAGAIERPAVHQSPGPDPQAARSWRGISTSGATCTRRHPGAEPDQIFAMGCAPRKCGAEPGQTCSQLHCKTTATLWTNQRSDARSGL